MLSGPDYVSRTITTRAALIFSLTRPELKSSAVIVNYRLVASCIKWEFLDNPVTSILYLNFFFYLEFGLFTSWKSSTINKALPFFVRRKYRGAFLQCLVCVLRFFSCDRILKMHLLVNKVGSTFERSGLLFYFFVFKAILVDFNWYQHFRSSAKQSFTVRRGENQILIVQKRFGTSLLFNIVKFSVSDFLIANLFNNYDLSRLRTYLSPTFRAI